MEMEFAGVSTKDIADIVKLCKIKGFDLVFLDNELQKRGYERLFTPDYDIYDQYDEWEDENYASREKFPSKHHYNDY